MRRTPLIRPAPPPAPVPFRDFVEELRPARRRRRILTVSTHVLLAVAVIFLGRYLRARDADRIVIPRPVAAAPSAAIGQSAAPAVTRVRAAGTSGVFDYAGGYGPVLGLAGPIHRFHLGVEKPDAPGAAIGFAGEVDRALGDRRGWIASRGVRFQRVPLDVPAEFTVYLASARTSERMCRIGGLETGAYTSCRLPGKVIVNDDRWEGAVRGYGAPLATYRAYAINHEVGHQLGHGHEACPGPGRLAPVMMQQTFGLKGCLANSWPYPHGRRYAGPAMR
ncbi:DUF3152 domain-containing protein [Actinoplanes sp. KI2]|uniref:DUF3152 domain-containing protein n=1 Tax=Actinoplanes sp. KI2 TaxID=2983315 RepID=UPI0021D5F403|nr:DUF3152 domain-containing protein [Actinoplanes sp. KI2]MCU7723171.1 DUF3152 domain-containing protein [Actinoplanes sp. KI2]